MSKYSMGLRNVGSYMVSGQPYLTGSSVNAGEEVCISFPYVTKNVTIRIPNAPNNAANGTATGAGQAWWFNNSTCTDPYATSCGFGMNNPGNLPPIAGTDDGWAWSIWFKVPIGITPPKNKLIFAHYGEPSGVTMWMQAPNPGTATNFNFFISSTNSGILSNDYGTTLTFNDVTTNWNHILVTQLTSSTHIYVNGAYVTKTTDLIGNITNLQKGWNADGRVFDSISYDEEMVWNQGMTSDEVDEFYNSGEWVNPNALSTKDSLVAWWTYGDLWNDAPVAELQNPPVNFLDVFKNAATGASYSSTASLGVFTMHTSHEEMNNVPGPFTSQTKGKLRINMLSTGSDSGANITDNSHYYQLQGYGDSISLPMKTKELYISAQKAQVTFEVIAELTNIPTNRMYALTGSGIDD